MSRERWIQASFKVGPLGEPDVRVLSYRGVETLSETFAFEVDFGRVDHAPIDLAQLLASPACLALRLRDTPDRFVNGIVDRVELLRHDPRRPLYRARVVPRVRRLEHVRRSRVFQDLSVPDIVKKVLDAAQVEQRWAVQGSHPARDYCVQYRESDLAFVQRLLEEEGIFFFFEHREDGHAMVLGDHARAFGALPGRSRLPFRLASEQAREDEHIHALAHEDRLAPGAAVLRDFDFERPALDLTASASAGDGPDLEWYDYPGQYVDPDDGRRLGRMRLEELRRIARTRRGESTCRGLTAGVAFELEGHPESTFDEKLVALRVEHAGEQHVDLGQGTAPTDRYANAFVAIADTAPCRPPRRTPRPAIAGVQTAIVVGPPGEEIFPDRHGRVKVQFHWDREGNRDEHSSCWVRLAQPWAGAGFGALTVPRIGQEVVVRFLESDPDRPVVVGAVYNGAHPPPVGLPGDKTKSTLRSASSLGSGGANELSFEDASGSEQVMLHAQKDCTIGVGNDKGQRVGNDASLAVSQDRSRAIGGNQKLRVDRDDASSVGRDQTLTVMGSRSTMVAQDHSESVTGAQSVAIAGTQSVKVTLAASASVGAAAALSVGGAYGIQVGGAVNHGIGGVKATEVGGACFERVGAYRSETVAKESSLKVGGGYNTTVAKNAASSVEKDLDEDVTGKATITITDGTGWSAKSLKLEADKLTLKVGGGVRLTLAKSGKVKMSGNEITVDGSRVALKGSKVKMEPS